MGALSQYLKYERSDIGANFELFDQLQLKYVRQSKKVVKFKNYAYRIWLDFSDLDVRRCIPVTKYVSKTRLKNSKIRQSTFGWIFGFQIHRLNAVYQ